MKIPWWEHSEKGVRGTDRQTDTDRKTETDRKTDSNLFKGKSIWNFICKMLAIFFRPKYRLIWCLFFDSWQGVYQPKLKRKIVHISKFQNKILYQSKKKKRITSYILNFIEALAGSQMKVKAVLNNFCNFISNPWTMHVPIKYTNSQYVQFAYYTIQNIMQCNIETICWTEKKKFNKIFQKYFMGHLYVNYFLK